MHDGKLLPPQISYSKVVRLKRPQNWNLFVWRNLIPLRLWKLDCSYQKSSMTGKFFTFTLDGMIKMVYLKVRSVRKYVVLHEGLIIKEKLFELLFVFLWVTWVYHSDIYHSVEIWINEDIIFQTIIDSKIGYANYISKYLISLSAFYYPLSFSNNRVPDCKTNPYLKEKMLLLLPLI